MNGDIVQATTEQWVTLTGSDGKVKARLNLTTGELVIRDRGINHKWPLLSLLKCATVQQNGRVLNTP